MIFKNIFKNKNQKERNKFNNNISDFSNNDGLNYEKIKQLNNDLLKLKDEKRQFSYEKDLIKLTILKIINLIENPETDNVYKERDFKFEIEIDNNLKYLKNNGQKSVYININKFFETNDDGTLVHEKLRIIICNDYWSFTDYNFDLRLLDKNDVDLKIEIINDLFNIELLEDILKYIKSDEFLDHLKDKYLFDIF